MKDGLQFCRKYGDMAAVVESLVFLARDAVAHDELDRATMLLDEVAAIERLEQPDRDDSFGDFLRPEIARRRGEYEQALSLLLREMAWRQRVGNPDFIAANLDGQGRVARSQGDLATAHALHQQALILRREAGHPIALAHSFHALALLAAERDGQAERAAHLFGAAAPYDKALYAFYLNLPIWRAEHEHAVTRVRDRLGNARADSLWAEGEAMTLEQAYAYALDS